MTAWTALPDEMPCGATTPHLLDDGRVVREVAVWYEVSEAVYESPGLTQDHGAAAERALREYAERHHWPLIDGPKQHGVVEQVGMGWPAPGEVARYCVVVDAVVRDRRLRSRWRAWRIKRAMPPGYARVVPLDGGRS